MNITCRNALLCERLPGRPAAPVRRLPACSVTPQRHAVSCAHSGLQSLGRQRAQLVAHAASVDVADVEQPANSEEPAPVAEQAAAEQQAVVAGSKQQQKERRPPNNDKPLLILSKVATGALLARLSLKSEVQLRTTVADPQASYRALCTVANAHRTKSQQQPGTSVLYAPSAGRSGQLEMTVVATQRFIPLDGYGHQIVAKNSSEAEDLSQQVLHKLSTEGRAVVRAAGAKACSAAASALVVARTAMRKKGYELAVLPRFVTTPSDKQGPNATLTVLEQHVVRQELPPATVVLGNTLAGGNGAKMARQKLDAQGRVRLTVPKGALSQVPALLRALQMPEEADKGAVQTEGAKRQWPKLLLLSFHGWQRRKEIETTEPLGTHKQDELLLGVRRVATSRLPSQAHQRPFNINATTDAEALSQALRSQLLVSGGRAARTDGSAEAALTALLAAVAADGSLEAQHDMKMGVLVDAMPERGSYLNAGRGRTAGTRSAAADGAPDGGADAAAEGAAAGEAEPAASAPEDESAAAPAAAGGGADERIKLRMFILELSEMTQSVLESPGCPLVVSVPAIELTRVLKATAAASLAVAGARSRGALLLLPSLRAWEGATAEEPGAAADMGIDLRLQRWKSELPELTRGEVSGSTEQGSVQQEGVQQQQQQQQQQQINELRVSSKTDVLKLRDAIVAKVMKGEADGAVLAFIEAPPVAAKALEALCRARVRLEELSPGVDVGGVLDSEVRDTTRSSGAAGLRTVFLLRLVPLEVARA